MEPWVAITMAAAAVQTGRFLLQRRLRAGILSTAGATFSRFVFSAPLVMVLVAVYLRASGQALPSAGGRFLGFALAGGLAQILATASVVALFARRNFAVGMTLKKTEVLQTALLGWLVAGEGVTGPALAALGLGFLGVLLLSPAPGAALRPGRVATPSAGLGLLSGAFFGVSAVSYREASLALGSGDALLRAGVTLAVVTTAQSLAMALWIAWREPGQIAAVARAWRLAGLVGLTSMAGSLCWFTAFTLERAALVNAVGQVELLFSLAASALFLGERLARREVIGVGVLGAGVAALVLVT